MIGLVKNRVFWTGASVPIALVASFLVYGSLQGSAGAARGPADAARTHDARAEAATSRTNEAATSASSSMSALESTPPVELPLSLNSAVAGINDPPPSSAAGSTIDRSQAHALLRDVGSLGVTVYAATTTTGKICMFDTHGPAGCIDSFTDAVPVLWEGEMNWSGEWTHIAGLAPDRVRSIALEGNGAGTGQVTLQNNAFYAEPSGDPTALVLTYDDGTTQTVELPAGPPPRPPNP